MELTPVLVHSCGVPFGPVPLILWALQKHPPVLNRDFMSPSFVFHTRSAFTFLPLDGKGYIDRHGQDIITDFYNPKLWPERCLSRVFRDIRSKYEHDQAVEYVKNCLNASKQLRQSLVFNPTQKYPPFSVLASKSWPTPTHFRARLRAIPKHSQTSARDSITHEADFSATDAVIKAANAPSTAPAPSKRHYFAPSCTHTLRLLFPARFGPGDGLVPFSSIDLPKGYSYTLIDTSATHLFLLNDLEGIRAALVSVLNPDATPTPAPTPVAADSKNPEEL
eukprot:jgi/Hompol1/3875/HPOL_006798-RA